MEEKQHLDNINGLKAMVLEYKDIINFDDADQKDDFNSVIDFYNWVFRQTKEYVDANNHIKSLEAQIHKYRDIKSEKMMDHI